VQVDVGASSTCSLDTVTWRLSGPIVTPPSGTNVKMAGEQSFFHGPEHRLVGLDVDVDVDVQRWCSRTPVDFVGLGGSWSISDRAGTVTRVARLATRFLRSRFRG
jgi:hypothetical protein